MLGMKNSNLIYKFFSFGIHKNPDVFAISIGIIPIVSSNAPHSQVVRGSIASGFET